MLLKALYMEKGNSIVRIIMAYGVIYEGIMGM